MFYFGMLIIYVHITGCLWFVVIKYSYDDSKTRWTWLGGLEENRDEFPETFTVAWIPPYDFFDGSE